MGKYTFKAVFICGLSAFGMGTQGWADSVGMNSTTVKGDFSLVDILNDNLALNYYGIYRGSSLTNVGGALQPLPTGELDSTSPQSFENFLTVGYKINKDLMVGVLGHFNYFPASLNTEISGIQMLDPRFVVQQNNIINNGGFNLRFRCFFQVPMSRYDSLIANQVAMSVTPTINANYEVPNTRLTVGIYSYLRGFIPNAGAPNPPTYTVIVAPNLNYQISRTVAATVWVDLVQATRRSGTGFFSGLENLPVDIEPGISWDVTSFLTINPVLNIYPGNPTLASTSLQAFIMAKAF